jgi:hypothetical protein
MIALRLRTWLARPELDRLLVEGGGSGDSSELRRRTEQLRSDRERGRLAAALRQVIEAAEQPPRPSAAAPLDREAVLGARGHLLELARDLDATEYPPARAVAMVERLLGDAASPLYLPAGGALESELIRARAAFRSR